MYEENRIQEFFEGITSVAIGKEVLYSAFELGRRLQYSPSDYTREIEELDPDEKIHLSRTMLQTIHRESSTDKIDYDASGWFVTEAGANSLILDSESPEARDLRDWLFKKVIPTIVRTGAFQGVPISKPPSIF